MPVNREEGTFQPEALGGQVIGVQQLGWCPFSEVPGTHGPYRVNTAISELLFLPRQLPCHPA